MITFDHATRDSTGAFLINELERLDQTLHAPLAAVTWHRDIQLRTDVSIADEISSFTVSTFASPGGVTGNGINWISKDANAIPNIALDVGIVRNPLPIWGTEIKWTIPELESAQKLGRPVDSQKLDGLKLKHNMDVDQIVYVGDSGGGASYGSVGLVNQPSGYVTNQGSALTGNWATATANQILADVNELLQATWKTSAYAVIPDTLLIDPYRYSIINQTIVSTAGNRSILNYLMENNLYTAETGGKLDIKPVKWLWGSGAGAVWTPLGANRMVAYNNNMNFVRYPLVPLQRTTLQYDSIYQKVSYFARLGVVEVVYPETVGYRDGL